MRIFLFHTSRYSTQSVASQRCKYWAKAFADEGFDVYLVRHGLVHKDATYDDFFLHKSHINSAQVNKTGNFNSILLPQHVLISKQGVNILGNFLTSLLSATYGIIKRTQFYNNLRRSFDAFYPKKLTPQKGDLIITSGPPSNVHEIGYELAIKNGCKWIMDYRDPFTFQRNSDFVKKSLRTKLTQFLMRPLEKKFLRACEVVSAVSSEISNDLPNGDFQKITIPNGYDDYEIDEQKINFHPKTFRVIFSGHVYTSQLLNNQFFEGVKMFFGSLSNEELNRIEFWFLGDAKNEGLKTIIRSYGLENQIQLKPWMKLDDAIELMYDASMFVQLQHVGFKQATNTKQFNYVAMEKPVLFFGGKDTKMWRFLQEFPAARRCSDAQSVHETLHQAFTRFSEGKSMHEPLSAKAKKEIARSTQAAKLVNQLKALKVL